MLPQIYSALILDSYYSYRFSKEFSKYIRDAVTNPTSCQKHESYTKCNKVNDNVNVDVMCLIRFWSLKIHLRIQLGITVSTCPDFTTHVSATCIFKHTAFIIDKYHSCFYWHNLPISQDVDLMYWFIELLHILLLAFVTLFSKSNLTHFPCFIYPVSSVWL